MAFNKGKKRASGPHSTDSWLETKRSRQIPSPPTMDPSEEELMEEESEEDENISQVATQDQEAAEQKSAVSTKQTHEAEVGVIERIQLTNFMCHRRLDVSLSPNVNFILGRNGSGKSAIMTAIVVALGGKATTTHRASSLKNFIRTGAKCAEVVLVMRNRGDDSYKMTEYGDTVTVHRTLRDDGTTNYKIMAANGSVVSHKREDLVNILDHWNIQVDNPVSLLDQDTSRNFLQSNNPGHKYKLFVRATRLEQISHDYEQAQEHQEIMQRSIKRNEELSEDLKKEAKVLEERLQMFDRLKEMEEKVKSLEMELQWVLVMELEREILPLEDRLQKQKNRIPRNQQNITQAEAKVAELDGLLAGVGIDLETVLREAEEISMRRAEKVLEKKEVDKKVKELRVCARRTEASIQEQSREKNALQQKMEDLVQMSQQSSEGERSRRQRAMLEAEEELRQLQEELSELTSKKRNAEETLKHCEEKMRQIERQRGQLNHEMREGENKVNMLRSSRSDQLLTHGPWMPALVKAVQAAQSQFRKPPKGPIGSMFKLHEYRWAIAIEAIIGKDLSAFVVDNPYDRATLQRIMSRVLNGQRGPDVLTSRFTGQAYDISRQRPRTQHPTVLDMMDIGDVEVRNVLIDQYHIDSLLLIEKRLDAERVIEVERPPRANVAYTIEGDQILTGRFYANKKRPLGIIQENVDRAIQEEQCRLRELETQLYQLDMSLKEIRKDAVDNKGKSVSVGRSLTAKQSRIHTVEMQLKELKSAEEEEESQEDIATYESEIQECQAKITEMMEQKKEYDNRMTELKAKLSDCSVGLSSVETEREQVTSRMEEIKAQHSEFEQERQKMQTYLQHYRDRVAEIQTNISTIEKQLSVERKRADGAAEEASKVCERIETRRTRKSIESEIGKLKHRIQQEEPQASEKEAVVQEYTSKIKLFQKTKKTVREHKTALKALRQGLTLRMKRYSEFQDAITARACVYFKNFLQMRDYDGNLKFNHTKETLSMEVRVDRHSKLSQATKNTKALSGGERSFTTVCFIMSLWEAIEAPFRCLDEFDVFMDMVNRRISMKLMMDSALEQRGKQFIFLTPQDMSQMGVTLGPHVKMLKLNPPDRGQTTLD